MRKRLVSAALAAAMALSMTACTSNPAEKETEAAAPADTEAAEEGEEKEAAADGDLITVGYAQVGAESDWRTANTESFKSTFTEENGYKLIFDDAQQKQENQISAIRNFIQQDVDYIVLAPVTETGWDAVLGEAKQAGIPVIIVDRMVDVKDDSLYTAWVGSNFELEGKKAAAYLDAYMKAKNMKDMKLVQEMYARGFEFMKIDIYRANAHEFQIIDGKLMPSLSTIDGLGDKAADAFVTAAAEGPFLSRDDLRQRSKLSKTVIDLMGDLGLLDGLPESNQLSLFDFA